jgi:hypothetical protein
MIACTDELCSTAVDAHVMVWTSRRMQQAGMQRNQVGHVYKALEHGQLLSQGFTLLNSYSLQGAFDYMQQRQAEGTPGIKQLFADSHCQVRWYRGGGTRYWVATSHGSPCRHSSLAHVS